MDTETASVEALAYAEALTSALAACRGLIPLDVYFSLPHADNAVGDPESVPDVLREYIRSLAAERDALQARVADYEAKLSAVMPADFKDWHQNARSEWPEVAAWVIKNLRADGDDARAALEAERDACAQLCDDISEEFQCREGRRYPELRTDAEAGASNCADAIRARSTPKDTP